MVAVYKAKLYVLCSMTVLPFFMYKLILSGLDYIYVVVYFIGGFRSF